PDRPGTEGTPGPPGPGPRSGRRGEPSRTRPARRRCRPGSRARRRGSAGAPGRWPPPPAPPARSRPPPADRRRTPRPSLNSSLGPGDPSRRTRTSLRWPTVIAYKFLDNRGRGVFSGFSWTARPAGAWVEAPEVVACRAGVHASRPADLAWWINEDLWEVELD